MVVEDLSGADGISSEDLLGWAGSLELASEHLVAKAIVQRAQRDGVALEMVTDFEALAGSGCSRVSRWSRIAGGTTRALLRVHTLDHA